MLYDNLNQEPRQTSIGNYFGPLYWLEESGLALSLSALTTVQGSRFIPDFRVYL